MSNDDFDGNPTEYLPGGAMANAYVPRGRQENRRITRRSAQPYPNSAEQRKIPVPNPPAGAPSGNDDVSALAGQSVTEIIPPINPSTNIHSGQFSATPPDAAANQNLDSPNAPYLDNRGALAASAPDLAGATPQVESYPQGIPPSYNPQIDPQQLREDQEYEEERADKRRLVKVAAIVSAIVVVLVGAVVVVAISISSKQIVPSERENTPSQSVTTSSSTPENTRSQPQTQEPTTSEPEQTETRSPEPTDTKTTSTPQPTSEKPSPSEEPPTASEKPSEQTTPSESNPQTK